MTKKIHSLITHHTSTQDFLFTCAIWPLTTSPTWYVYPPPIVSAAFVVYFDQRLGDAHPERWSKSGTKIFNQLLVWCKLKKLVFFFAKIWGKFVTFLRFFSFFAQKMLKLLIRPAFRVHSTQMLVEIYFERSAQSFICTLKLLLKN